MIKQALNCPGMVQREIVTSLNYLGIKKLSRFLLEVSRLFVNCWDNPCGDSEEKIILL